MSSNKINKAALMTAIMLSAWCLSAEMSPASAQPSGDITRTGCILKYAGQFHFLDGRMKGQKMPDLPADARKVAGSCQAGTPGGVPAITYLNNASRRPENYAPLPPSQTRASSRHLGNGNTPSYQYVRYQSSAVLNAAGIDGRSTAYANAIDAVGTFYIATLVNGQTAITQTNAGIFGSNRSGTLPGFIFTDPVNFIQQAALFRGNAVELIPPEPGEFSSIAIAINDKDEALVISYDTNFVGTLFLYAAGKKNLIDIGFDVNGFDVLFMFGINNDRIMTYVRADVAHKLDLRTMKDTALPPLPGDNTTWAIAINNRGDVLGYSFTPAATERIGVWHPNNRFEVYFTEGTPAIPTISNYLAFNEDDKIVISLVSDPPEEIGNLYFLPRPGVRLNMADFTSGQPADAGNFSFVPAINARGDIVGHTDTFEAFVLDALNNR
uniref:hypothetical protein n=1 Tax=Cupriavidus yeoncheonensis TaxID=1462994 RepID=UPI003F497341